MVVGGKNKYLINGAAVQASQVQNLFHSVQLNVNNPHFLIMQGRITKVRPFARPSVLGVIYVCGLSCNLYSHSAHHTHLSHPPVRLRVYRRTTHKQVLNMKPHEILGMIEEAAGTRMFENKKQAALKTIEKKSAKVRGGLRECMCR